MAQVSMWRVVSSEARDSKEEKTREKGVDENAVREYTVAVENRRVVIVVARPKNLALSAEACRVCVPIVGGHPTTARSPMYSPRDTETA